MQQGHDAHNISIDTSTKTIKYINTTTNNSMGIITNNISILLILGIITKASARLGSASSIQRSISFTPTQCPNLSDGTYPWGYGIWDNHGCTSDPTCTCKEDEYRGNTIGSFTTYDCYHCQVKCKGPCYDDDWGDEAVPSSFEY